MDEPFVDDAAFRVVSGVPVRYYPGGKEQGSCVDIPCPTGADEGDVLTVVDGAPVWAPPTGGSTPSGPTLDAGYWLKPKTCYLKQDQLPYNDGLRARANYRGGMLGRPLAPSYWTEDQIVLASGTSAGFSGVLLPATTDGQTFETPWDTDVETYYRPVSFAYNGEFKSTSPRGSSGSSSKAIRAATRAWPSPLTATSQRRLKTTCGGTAK